MISYEILNPYSLKREELEKVQELRLREAINYIYYNSKYYNRLMKGKGLKPDDIRNVADLRKLPFTTKEDLAKFSYPYGGEFLAVPFEQVSLWHMTSGTTGNPTINAYTEGDVKIWGDLVGRCLILAGVNNGDIVANLYGYGLFTGGIGLHMGLQRVNAKIIPWGAGRAEALAKVLKDFKVNVITGTPSFELYVAEVIKKQGIDAEKELNLRLAIPGAEVMNNEMLTKIERELGLKARGGGARQIYGLTEAMGPGVAQACPEDGHDYLHIWSDYFLVEVVDPETGEVLGEEEEGELVFTHLFNRAIPLIRYRTRDITSLNYDHSCKTVFPRIKTIKGRIDDVIFYKGLKIFPSVIASALFSIPQVIEFQVIIEKKEESQKFTIKIETSQNNEQLKDVITTRIRELTLANPSVELLPPGSLPRYEGKSKRFLVR